MLRFEDLELDPLAHEARRGGRLLELTRTEFLLLELLMRHPRQVLTRATIFDRVWGYDFGPASNSLEVYVGYLRRKTEAAGEPRLRAHRARRRLRAEVHRRDELSPAHGAAGGRRGGGGDRDRLGRRVRRDAQRAARADRREPAPEAHPRPAAGRPDQGHAWPAGAREAASGEGKLPRDAARRRIGLRRARRQRRQPSAGVRPRQGGTEVRWRTGHGVTIERGHRSTRKRRARRMAHAATRTSPTACRRRGTRRLVLPEPDARRRRRATCSCSSPTASVLRSERARARCCRSPPRRARSPPAGAARSSATRRSRGTHVRVLTERAPPKAGVWQVALPLTDVEQHAHRTCGSCSRSCASAASRSRPRSGCSSRARRSCRCAG